MPGDCDDPVILQGCGDTTIDAGGIDNVGRVFPDDAASELPLWDSIAQEAAKLSGVNVQIYSVRRAKHLHPLYREPSTNGAEWEFHGPWEMYGGLDFDQGNEIDTEVSAEGLQKTSTAVLWVARKAFEDVGAPEPKVGDVVAFWQRSPFESKFDFWDVTKANPDGNIFSSETFVQYRIELKHRSRFEPGRKTEGKRL